MNAREPITILREVPAIQIPDGTRVIIPEGARVMITQELGGSYTIMTERGALFRIDDKDAEALGKEAPSAADSVAEGSLEDRVWAQMRACYDPEIPANIVDLGLIYDCRIREASDGGHEVEVKMTLTAPGCGMGPVLAEDVRRRIEEIPGVRRAHIEIVFDPPWNPNMMTEAAKLQLGFL